MDIKDVNINNVKSLTEEDLASLKRQAAKNFASLVLLKLALFAAIAALSKTLNRRLDAKK